MSSITAITRSLPGERVLDLSPEPSAITEAITWLRRPNLFAGRALTATTLEARSAWMAGRIATRGQAFTPGVVRGLEVEYRELPPIGSAPPQVRLSIAAGQGLSVDGETLMIGEIDVDLFSLQVVAPPEVLAGGNFGTGALLPRMISNSRLGELLTNFPNHLPLAGVLVLQPVSTQRANLDPDDPCDRCGCDGAVSYEDWRYADAVRLLWYVWPVDAFGVPPPHTDPQRRNRLAFTVFDAERALPPDGVMPWEPYGVPVALMGVDSRFVPTFIDHAAVVRRGGHGRYSRLQLAQPQSGLRMLRMDNQWRLPALWQAQFEQLSEHVASQVLQAEQTGAAMPTSQSLAAQFDRLPPCGLLPTSAIDTTDWHSDFFPAGMDLDAVPIPLDQLDLAIRECSGLAPLDLALGERVRVLVPVSQASYEPRLLHREEIDPEFDATLRRFLIERSRALAGRQSLRLKASVLATALRGASQVPPVPALDNDPMALEPELSALAEWGPPTGDVGHRSQLRDGLHEHGFDQLPMGLSQNDVLYVWVYLDPDVPPCELMLEWRSAASVARAYWGENLIQRGADGTVARMPMGSLPEIGRWVRLEVMAGTLGLGVPGNNTGSATGMMFTLYDGRAAYGGAGFIAHGEEHPWYTIDALNKVVKTGDEPFELLSRAELMAPFEPRFGVMPGATNAMPDGDSEDLVNLLADPLLDGVLSPKELAQLRSRGVDGFIEFLKARADRADDIVDYGFVKVQTDLYRVRQIMLGATEASRLAISPALASIAQAETAVATHERIKDFISKTKINVRPGAEVTDAVRSVSRVAEVNEERASLSTEFGTTAFSSASAGPTVSSFAMRASDSFVADNTMLAFSGSRATDMTMVAAFTQPKATGFGIDFGTIGSDVGTIRADFDAVKGDVGTVKGDFGIKRSIEPTKIAPLGITPKYTVKDVVGSTPLSGNINLRTVSLAERMKIPESQRARDYATATRHEAMMALINLADSLIEEDGGVTPGLFESLNVWGLKGDEFLKDVQLPPASPTPPQPVLKRSFGDFLDKSKRNLMLSHLLVAPDNGQSDEAGYFSDSADMADRSIAIFRQVEGRIRSYRQVIAICETARDKLLQYVALLGARENAWNERLAEARHDVSVTRALIAEELDRIAAINQRRRHILDNEVRFLAYIRPRAADNLLAAPAKPLNPGLLEAPAPACLQAHADVPDELDDMLKVLREAPAIWLIAGPQLLDRLNRIDLLAKTMRTAQLRHFVSAQRAELIREVSLPRQVGRFQTAITNVRKAQRVVIEEVRAASQHIDISRVTASTWQYARQEAARVVSLGDLIDGDHGQGGLARSAADFFDRFSHICGCLHASFSEVLPSIRLDWAETLSQFDDAPNLRNLGVLQRWAEIDYVDRRRMQGLVDWLFDQLDTAEARAVGLVNDIVRMCLLLASHAPVGQIIAGRMPRPVTARPGVRIPLMALDPQRLRIGMHALVYRGDEVVTRAVVEDIGNGEISARVLQTLQTSVELDTSMRVQFAHATSVSLAGRAGTKTQIGRSV
jgi:hypothetical protein